MSNLSSIATRVSSSGTTVTATNVTDQRIKCYACGLPSGIEQDLYCDPEKNTCDNTRKSYNHSCEVMGDSTSDIWVKTCNEGVKSCYIASASYLDQSKQIRMQWTMFMSQVTPFSDPIFRDCAQAKEAHDVKCNKISQAVTVVVGKKSVDVPVELCHCSGNLCNLVKSNSNMVTMTMTLLALPALVGMILS